MLADLPARTVGCWLSLHAWQAATDALCGCVKRPSVEAFFWPMFSSSDDSSTVSRILKPTFGLLWSCYLVAGFSLHYYYAVTTLPGSPRDAPGTTRYRRFFSWRSTQRDLSRASSSSEKKESRRRELPIDAAGSDAAQRSCRKCPEIASADHDGWVQPPKPERTHHCSACKVCVLKYDHQSVASVNLSCAVHSR